MFELTREQKQIQKAAKEFAEGEFREVARELDAKEEFDDRIWKKAAELGFWGYPFNSGIYYILWLRFLGPLTCLMISPYGIGSTSIACCKRR